MQLVTIHLRYHQLCHSCVRGVTSSHVNSLGSIQDRRLSLGTLNLFGIHIIPPLNINAGTHLTYPQRDGRLSQPWPGWFMNRYGPQDLIGKGLLLYQRSYLSQRYKHGCITEGGCWGGFSNLLPHKFDIKYTIQHLESCTYVTLHFMLSPLVTHVQHQCTLYSILKSQVFMLNPLATHVWHQIHCTTS